MTEDPQRDVFTGAGPDDWVTQVPLVGGATVYEPGDTTGIRAPEDWDASGWDNERQPPKTLDEAREALDSRIANPHAPDGPTHAGAYDGDGDR